MPFHPCWHQHHSTFTFESSLPTGRDRIHVWRDDVTDKLLAQEKDESVRRDILFKQMDDAFATILRQVYFALFEKQAHEMVQNNATVMNYVQRISRTSKNNSPIPCELSDDFKWEWVSIPHIYHTRSMCMRTRSVKLLVFSLYRQFKTEGESFKPNTSRSFRRAARKRPQGYWQTRA